MKFRDARVKAGMSVSDVSEKLGVTRTAVYQWESEMFQPRVPMLVKIAKLYGVTVDDLLEGRDATTETK